MSRLGQRLGISLLELNTFVHALCTLVTYLAWWKKPLDVEDPEPIPVQFSSDAACQIAAMYEVSNLDRKEANRGVRYQPDEPQYAVSVYEAGPNSGTWGLSRGFY